MFRKDVTTSTTNPPPVVGENTRSQTLYHRGGKAAITWYLDPCSSIDATPQTPTFSQRQPTTQLHFIYITPFTPHQRLWRGIINVFK